MLQQFLQIKEALLSTIALVNPQLAALTLVDWETVKDVCEILQPFEKVTAQMSSESYSM